MRICPLEPCKQSLLLLATSICYTPRAVATRFALSSEISHLSDHVLQETLPYVPSLQTYGASSYQPSLRPASSLLFPLIAIAYEAFFLDLKAVPVLVV